MIDRTVEEIYNTHGFYLFKRCRALLGSDEEAHDAMHEVFVKLMVSRPKLDHDRPVLAWLNRVATNYCFNRLRAQRYRRHLPLDSVRHIADESAASFVEMLAAQRDLVCWLLLSVDERTRHVVVAYFFDEHGVDRIASDFRISVPTVRRVLRRFLERARVRVRATTPAQAIEAGGGQS